MRQFVVTRKSASLGSYVRYCGLGGYSCSCNMLSKLRHLKDHPANKVLQPHWMNRFRKYNENTDPIYNKVFTFLDKTRICAAEMAVRYAALCVIVIR